MQGGEKLSLEQIRALLEASQEVRFAGHSRVEIYEWIEKTLREHDYAKQGREAKGLLRSYVAKMTGQSRAQVTRLIGKYMATGEVRPTAYRRHRFPTRYTRIDTACLASVDEAHDTMSGPATRKILEREFSEYGKQEYERLASISIAHLYRLRKSKTYRTRQATYTKTRPAPAAIGERRCPEPEGRPGYLRVDTVHQGDRDGVKGVYHINAVDEVTQWQVVACVPQISEAWLAPALYSMLAQFPFKIRGFHSDNGSEFINHNVAAMLKKLLVEQTKSRPRRSNDNGLVEAKNGAVIRKHMGYVHIAAPHAASVQQFYEEHLNDYLNFHRPCGQVEITIDAKGKQRRVYPRYETPWEVYRALPKASRYLKPGVTLRGLTEKARQESDTEAAKRMQQAKRILFDGLFPKRRSA
jgi:transposase InsO family protein